MKKTLLAAALLAGFAGAASAQSSVTLYGIVDIGLRYSNVSYNQDISASKFGVVAGQQSTSRFGFKGVEDLGNGNKVSFVLEEGINAANGEAKAGFTRASWLGWSNNSWGDVRLGRYTNLTSDWVVGLDPMGQGFQQLNMGSAFTTGNTVRYNNLLMYRTPVMSGFQAGLGYSFDTGVASNGEPTLSGTTAEKAAQAFSTSNRTRAMTLGAKYGNGPVQVAATYERFYAASSNSTYGGDSISSWNIGGSYDFKVVKVMAAFGQTRNGFMQGPDGAGSSLARVPTGTTAAYFDDGVGYNSYIVGATIPVNQVSRVMLSWTMVAPNTNMKDAYNAQNQNAYNLAYSYDFTKRTNLYAFVGTMQNFATVDTAKSTTVGLGLRHQF